MFGLWIRFFKSIYFEYYKKLIILLITPPQKKRCKFSLEHASLRLRCTHLSCVRSKNESECIDFQCQNFKAFVALKSVSRIVIATKHAPLTEHGGNVTEMSNSRTTTNFTLIFTTILHDRLWLIFYHFHIDRQPFFFLLLPITINYTR